MPLIFTRLRDADRHRLADTLEAIAGELRAGHARHVQQALATAATVGYPSRSSTSPGQPGNEVDEDGRSVAPHTAVEAAALRPDRAALDAKRQLFHLDMLVQASGPAYDALRSLDPNRPIELCKRCGHPLERGWTRCRRIIDGNPCQGSERPEHCRNPRCATKLVTGQIRDGRCPACARHWSRYGTERIPREALALGDNVIEADQ